MGEEPVPSTGDRPSRCATERPRSEIVDVYKPFIDRPDLMLFSAGKHVI